MVIETRGGGRSRRPLLAYYSLTEKTLTVGKSCDITHHSVTVYSYSLYS